MKNPINLKFEFLFLLVAVVLATIVVAPILQAEIEFPFLIKNIILVFLAVLIFKHIFFLKFTWLNHYQKIQIAIIPLSVALIFTIMRMLNAFTTFCDEVALGDIMPHLAFEDQKFYTKYIRIEYIAIAVTAIAGSMILPIRLLINIWKQVNNR